MKLRKVMKEEYPLIENLVYEVFKNTSFSDGVLEKELVKEIREREYYIPELDLVAEEDGNIVGHFILSRFPISGKHEEEMLILTPVSVVMEKQKHGVGTRMLQEGLKTAAELGYKGVVVEGDYRYYRRFGFKTSTEFGIYASEKNPPPAPEYLMALELCANGLADIQGEVDYSIYKVLTV